MVKICLDNWNIDHGIIWTVDPDTRRPFDLTESLEGGYSPERKNKT